MRRNRLRELLRDGKPSVGTHLLSQWPTVTEIVGSHAVYVSQPETIAAVIEQAAVAVSATSK